MRAKTRLLQRLKFEYFDVTIASLMSYNDEKRTFARDLRADEAYLS